VPAQTFSLTRRAETLDLYLEPLDGEVMPPGGRRQKVKHPAGVKLHQLLAPETEQMSVGSIGYMVIARDAVPDIDLFGQTYLTDQFHVAPDGAVTYRRVLPPDTVVEFVDRDVLFHLEE